MSKEYNPYFVHYKIIFLFITCFIAATIHLSCKSQNKDIQSPQLSQNLSKPILLQKSKGNITPLAMQKLYLVVVCSKVPVYTKPSMSAKKAPFLLHKGKILRIYKRIVIKSKRSFDFAKTEIKGTTYYVPLQYLGPEPKAQKMSKGNIIIGEEVVDKKNSLPLAYKPNDLKLVPVKYRANGYKNRKMMLRKEALKAFIRLHDDAKKKGYNLKFLSCFRTTNYQAGPYKRTIRAVGPKQRSSAKPGHSEHQLGTVCDVTTSKVGYKLTQALAKTKVHRWIKKNAHNYAIYISYGKKDYMIKGYIWEPWHLRYWGENSSRR